MSSTCLLLGASWRDILLTYATLKAVIPTIYMIQLEKVVQNLSLTLAEMINDTAAAQRKY